MNCYNVYIDHLAINVQPSFIRYNAILPVFFCRFLQVIIITYRSTYTGVVNPPQRFAPQDLLTYEEAHKSLIPAAYITFQFEGNEFDKYQDFIIGDGAQSNNKTRSRRSSDAEIYYHNKPLQPNTNYRVFLRAFVTEVL